MFMFKSKTKLNEVKISNNITIKDEKDIFEYLQKMNFSKNYQKLVKKLKNKSIVIYGAGIVFDVINKYYDLSKLNIIGIADSKFNFHEPDETYCNYKVYSQEELSKLHPDYILVATKFYIRIIDNLYYNLPDKKTKIIGIIKKPFWTMIHEYINVTHGV